MHCNYFLNLFLPEEVSIIWLHHRSQEAAVLNWAFVSQCAQVPCLEHVKNVAELHGLSRMFWPGNSTWREKYEVSNSKRRWKNQNLCCFFEKNTRISLIKINVSVCFSILYALIIYSLITGNMCLMHAHKYFWFCCEWSVEHSNKLFFL